MKKGDIFRVTKSTLEFEVTGTIMGLDDNVPFSKTVKSFSEAEKLLKQPNTTDGHLKVIEVLKFAETKNTLFRAVILEADRQSINVESWEREFGDLEKTDDLIKRHKKQVDDVTDAFQNAKSLVGKIKQAIAEHGN